MAATKLMDINMVGDIDEDALVAYLESIDAREAGRHSSTAGVRIAVVAKKRKLGVSEKAQVTNAVVEFKGVFEAMGSDVGDDMATAAENILTLIKE